MKRGTLVVGMVAVAGVVVALGTCRRDETPTTIRDAETTSRRSVAAPRRGTSVLGQKNRELRDDYDALKTTQSDLERRLAELDRRNAEIEASLDKNGLPLDISSLQPVRARFLTAGRTVAVATSDVCDFVRTDDDGFVDMLLPVSHRGLVMVRMPDGVLLALKPPQDDAKRVDLGDVRVEPAGTIEGHVVDEHDRPVGGAHVELLSSELDCLAVATDLTDSSGAFTLRRVGPYVYEVAVRGDFGARVAGVRASTKDLRLVARPMFAATLRLLDDATGAPIKGLWTDCELRRPGAAWQESFHETRRNESSVKLLLDAAGTYEIDVRLGGPDGVFTRRVPAVELSPDRENVVDVRLVKD